MNALKACYKEASRKTGHVFYLPILDKSVWKITRLKDGKEDTIDKNQFVMSITKIENASLPEIETVSLKIAEE